MPVLYSTKQSPKKVPNASILTFESDVNRAIQLKIIPASTVYERVCQFSKCLTAPTWRTNTNHSHNAKTFQATVKGVKQMLEKINLHGGEIEFECHLL